MFDADFVSVHILDKANEQFLLLRRSGPFLAGVWQMVTGKIVPPESADSAAVRELREETGLATRAFYRADRVECFVELQTQKLAFAPVFVAYCSANEHILLSSEHDQYEWVNFATYKSRLLFPEQKQSATHVFEHFVLNEPPEVLRVFPSS